MIHTFGSREMIGLHNALIDKNDKTSFELHIHTFLQESKEWNDFHDFVLLLLQFVLTLFSLD